MTTHEGWMTLALKEAQTAFAKNEVPVGAVIVHGGVVIGRGYNQIEMMNDPTAHAEMIALTAAASYLNSKWLKGCTFDYGRQAIEPPGAYDRGCARCRVRGTDKGVF